MSERVTAVDVARVAGVSQATVSRILAGKTNFSQKTIDCVKNTAEELGYKRNVLASSLSSNRTNIIAVVSVKSENPFVHETLSQLVQYLRKEKKQVLYIETEEEHKKYMEEVIDDVASYQVDGVIVLYAVISKEVRDFIRKIKMPVVIFNRAFIHENMFSVCSDNSEACRSLANYLVEKGHRSFGTITGPGIVLTEGSTRTKSFLGRLAELGYTDTKLVYCESYSYYEGARAAQELMTGETHPTAVFCDSDALAIGAMCFIRNELGLCVPQDVAVVGFDNIQMSAWNVFDLTTFEHDNIGMIHAAVQYIDDINNGVERTDKIRLFPCRLVERGST